MRPAAPRFIYNHIQTGRKAAVKYFSSGGNSSFINKTKLRCHLVEILGIFIFTTSRPASSTHWPWSCQESPGAAYASAPPSLRHTACRRCGSFSRRCSERRSWTSPAGSERRIHPRPHSGRTPRVLVTNAYSYEIEIFHLWPRLTFSLKCISTNLPKRLLLLFLTVFAFPKASRRGLAGIQDGKSLFFHHTSLT